jgi:hypothetical protein
MKTHHIMMKYTDDSEIPKIKCFETLLRSMNNYIPDDVRWGDINLQLIVEIHDGNETLESVDFRIDDYPNGYPKDYPFTNSGEQWSREDKENEKSIL